MLYIAKYTNQVLDDGKWIDIGVLDGERIVNEECPETEYYKVSSFEKLQDFAKDFYGLNNENTFLFSRPCVGIRFGLTCMGKITKKKFNKLGPLEFRTIYKPYHPTMKWLVENLSADNFAQYAKDRNWNNIVISE